MKKIVSYVSLFIFVSILLGGCGINNGRAKLHSSVTVKGKILIKGHLPSSYVALKINSRLYYNLVGPLSRVLRSSYQGKKVIISGTIVADALGPGMPARIEVTNIDEIISRK